MNNANEIYTTGSFNNTVDFNPGTQTFNLQSDGNTDIFISRLDSSGNYVWAIKCGGVDLDYGNSIIITASQEICLTGTFSGTGTFLGNTIVTTSTSDIFILKLDSLISLKWVKQINGTLNDRPFAVAEDAFQNIYCTGYFVGTTDFDPSTSVITLLHKVHRIFLYVHLISTVNFYGLNPWVPQLLMLDTQ